MPSEDEFKEWSARLVGVIAGEIKRYRTERKVSARQLSDEIAARYGLRMGRAVVANLECGARTTLSVPELLVLAHFLEVPPLLLLCPVGRQEDPMEILPGHNLPAWEAAQWVTGESPLVSEPTVRGEWTVDVPDAEAYLQGSKPVALYRRHAEHIERRSMALVKSGGSYYAAERAEEYGDKQRAHAARIRGGAEDRMVEYNERSLRDVRAKMRELGLSLPELPPDLRFLDTGAAGPTEAEIEASLAAISTPLAREEGAGKSSPT